MADGRLPAVFNDAAFHRVRQDRSTLTAAVDAARIGPQQLMDFLVLAGGKSSTQLQSVQELADRLALAQGASSTPLGCTND